MLPHNTRTNVTYPFLIRDLLQELATVSDLPEPLNNKRERDADSPGSSYVESPNSGYQNTPDLANRPMVSRKNLGTASTSSNSPRGSSNTTSSPQIHMISSSPTVQFGTTTIPMKEFVMSDLQSAGVATYAPSSNQPSSHASYGAPSHTIGQGHEHGGNTANVHPHQGGTGPSISIFDFLQTDPTMMSFPLAEGNDFLPPDGTDHQSPQSRSMRNITAYSLSGGHGHGGHGHGHGTGAGPSQTLPPPGTGPGFLPPAPPSGEQGYNILGNLDPMHMSFKCVSFFVYTMRVALGLTADLGLLCFIVVCNKIGIRIFTHRRILQVLVDQGVLRIMVLSTGGIRECIEVESFTSSLPHPGTLFSPITSFRPHA